MSKKRGRGKVKIKFYLFIHSNKNVFRSLFFPPLPCNLFMKGEKVSSRERQSDPPTSYWPAVGLMPTPKPITLHKGTWISMTHPLGRWSLPSPSILLPTNWTKSKEGNLRPAATCSIPTPVTPSTKSVTRWSSSCPLVLSLTLAVFS
jgi:hypothetical protein